jgi:hypothetical protein
LNLEGVFVKKIIFVLFLPVMMSMCLLNAAIGAEESEQIPDNVTIQHWTCREVAELGKKYGAARKLPDAVVMEGKSCSRREVASCLLSVIDNVLEKCEKEGTDAVPMDDLNRIARLCNALKSDLEGIDGYLTRREAIESILAKPAVTLFLIKTGINGFLRVEGTGDFRLVDFSYAPGHGEGRFLYRMKPYVYWHPTDYLDVHLEGQGYGFTGGSQYYGKYSLYQGFIEGRLPEKALFTLKAGRQEFNYGSAFILGSNTFYDGLVFDAFRLRIQPADALCLDLLGGLYGTPFNNGMKGNLSGVFATYKLSDDNTIEAYGFHDTGSADPHGGEYRDIWGLRGVVEFGPIGIEFEPVFETGKIFNPGNGGNDNISAYGGHVDVSVESTLAGRRNQFVLSYALGSGDREAADDSRFRKEFSNPNNDSFLLGDMNVVGDFSGITVGDFHASGIQDFTLGWGIDITKVLNFTATGHYFLANEVPAGFSKNLGLETDFILTYAISDELSIMCACDHFFTGRFFRDASGNDGDVSYGYVMFQFNLSKTWHRGGKI